MKPDSLAVLVGLRGFHGAGAAIGVKGDDEQHVVGDDFGLDDIGMVLAGALTLAVLGVGGFLGDLPIGPVVASGTATFRPG